jgi:hypothetical protein
MTVVGSVKVRLSQNYIKATSFLIFILLTERRELTRGNISSNQIIRHHAFFGEFQIILNGDIDE